MFTRSIPRYFHIINRGLSSNKEKWDLCTAVCLERRPIITPKLNELEEKFHQLLTKIEFEKSMKSDHEIQHEHDLKQIEALKQGLSDIDITIKNTAQDFLDASTEEFAKFTYAPKITEADKNNDVKSLKRKLDKHLMLVVKQKIGDKEYYLLPQALREDGETLRQTAERVLKNTCGNDLNVQFFGNAPSGFYKYKYPKEIREKGNSLGAKVFFYAAKYASGNLPETGLDYKWLDRNEISSEFTSEYYKSVKQFLIH